VQSQPPGTSFATPLQSSSSGGTSASHTSAPLGLTKPRASSQSSWLALYPIGAKQPIDVAAPAVASPCPSPSVSIVNVCSRPSSVAVSQSSSTPLHTSGEVGDTPARVSSQSDPQCMAPLVSALQQSASGTPSESESRTPNVDGSQSSSRMAVSHTSTSPGARFASASSQSSPPQRAALWPS